MSIVNPQAASERVSELLRGTQLDTIRVYSLIVQLGFVRLGAADNLPDEVWISVSGSLIVEENPATVGEVGLSRDFFDRRASVLSAVYRLIGQTVTAASVSDSGELQVHLGGKCLRAEADDDANLEEVWSVFSDSPETTAEHRWHVSLDESGALSSRVTC